MRGLLCLLLAAALTVPAAAEIRLDFDAQWRLAEGSVAPGPPRLQGRFVSLAESYLIIDPVLTAGFEGRGPGWSLGLGFRGLFPHPLAGETRLWPLLWGEVDLGWLGGRLDVGTGYGGFPPGGFTRLVPDLVPTLSLFASVPAWKFAAGSFEWQPRLGTVFRGFVATAPQWELNPFTFSLGLGFASRF